MRDLDEYIRRQGDPPGVGARKWGGRYLFSNDPIVLNPPPGAISPRATRKATVINIADLDRPRLVNVQLRFASVVGAGNLTPKLPFTYDSSGGIVKIRVTVTRSPDMTAPSTSDIYDIYHGDTLPVDIVLARSLQVDVEAMTLGSEGSMWIEAAATIVDYPGPRNLVHPWEIVNQQKFVPVGNNHSGGTGAILLLHNNADRAQFTVCNTSTTRNLLIGFQPPQPDNIPATANKPTWGPPINHAAFVLPANGFYVYESPIGACFKGMVFGVWDGADASGGALVMEGTVF
jgi:hypothetical protein